uniref:Putative secreted peptide n=1 Tax=Anopheles braziliensis TaxID=58242 RepID=A0A2M3ZVW2_9DIPT
MALALLLGCPYLQAWSWFQNQRRMEWCTLWSRVPAGSAKNGQRLGCGGRRKSHKTRLHRLQLGRRF